jgi:cyclophilin family peptidyl-prolyl cis-trans isomerase
MIQGGDPTGTGTGGPGYQFRDEVHSRTSYPRGTVAMANSGPNTNGSQFFIVHQDAGLPNSYTIFGEVTDGMDVVDAIATKPTGAQDRPNDPTSINSITINEA